MTAIKYWLWLTTRSGLSIESMHRVLDEFGTPEECYYADDERIDDLVYLRPASKASLKNRSMERPDQIIADCDRLGIRICCYTDSDYPDRLRQIWQPPLVLYMQGRPIRFDEECAIAIAGTRSCSEYGRRMADRMAWDITRGGGLVVTGVVPGCDYAAATAALRAGGPVVCVLAGGLDVPFNEYSKDLYRRVLKNGLLISEYPPGREPAGKNFPVRNRILTGLCVGTVCVEGRMRSGTMLVAKNALDQNRDVFAVPTGADKPEGAGMLELIKNGAIPVTHGSEVLEQYASRFPLKEVPAAVPTLLTEEEEVPGLFRRRKVSRKSAEKLTSSEKKIDKSENKDYIDLRDHAAEYSEEEQAILRALRSGDMSADDLVAATGLPTGKALASLTMLTIRGLLSEQAGRYHCEVSTIN